MEFLLEIFTLAATLFKAAGSYFALILADRCMKLAVNNGGLYLFMYIPGVFFVIMAAYTICLSGVEFKALVDMYIYGEDDGNEGEEFR